MFAIKNSFTTQEILEATRGRLIAGRLDDRLSGVSIDSRTAAKGEVFIAIKGERFDGHDFVPQAIEKQAGCVIIKKDKPLLLNNRLPPNLIAVTDTVCALSDLAYYNRKRFDIPVIGITGSNGKTTTKEMLACLLASRYRVLKNEGTQNNIIGLSLNLLKLASQHEIAVFELGTNHFGEISRLIHLLAPSVGIITNIGLAHLEFFHNIEGVLREKWQLAKELSWPCIVLLNADDPLLKEKLTCDLDDLKAFSFGINNTADFMARKIVLRDNKIHFFIQGSPLVLNTAAAHNVYNALAAYAAARIFSVDAYDIINRFKKFKIPAGRFEMKKINGLNIIDDAYNANPASFHYAIEAFKGLSSLGKKIIVIGDMLELGEEKENLHRVLGYKLGRAGADMIIGVGGLAHTACEAAILSGFNPKAVYKCSANQEVRRIISACTKKDDIILFKGSRQMKLEEVFKGL